MAGGIALGIGLFVPDATIVQLALFCLLLPLMAIPISCLNMSGLEYRRSFPDAAYKSEDFEVGLSLENTKKHFGAFDITVVDEVIHYHHNRPTFFSSLDPGQTGRQVKMTRITKRGIYDSFRYKLTSSFPLGLVLNERVETLPGHVVVYPIPKLPLDNRKLLESGVGFGGFRNSAASNSAGEFKCVREYRPGDNVRLISWPVSARFQKLILKEMEQPGPKRVTVVFHSYKPPRSILSRRSFEKSLQLLSGLFTYLYHNFIPFEFLASFSSWRRTSVLVDPTSHRRALTVLASAQMYVSEDVNYLMRVMGDEAKTSVSVVVVSNTPTRYWVPLLPHVYVPVFYMDNSSAGVSLPRDARPVL